MNCRRFLFLYLLLLLRRCTAEFTVVLPDSSSPLVDSPQTGFSTRARTDPTEQAAVYAVMASTGNAWAGSIPDVCRGRWHGIECTPDTDDVYHVVSLSFGALSDDTAFPTCDAAATLSPEILKLAHLRSLFFYRCFAANPQPIPAFLGRLGPTLRSLVLRDNGHVSPIPPELFNLTSLKLLDLHGNRLGSGIPPGLARLTRIRKLDLSGNQLTGRIPELNAPDLNVLDLSRNSLHGPIPASLLARSHSLLKLDLSRNRVTGPIPDTINNLKNLILLDLGHNSLSCPLPDSLAGLASLRTLILKANPMNSTTIPANWFSGLKSLTTLVLSNMGLNGPIPESIGDLPGLRVLYLDGNELNGSIPASLAKLRQLSEVRLENNELEGVVPFEKETVWRMGRKMRVENNSGLCYDMRQGEMGGFESLSGITYCDPQTVSSDVVTAAGPQLNDRTTRHLRLVGVGGLREAELSGGRRLGIGRFGMAAGILFSVLSLL